MESRTRFNTPWLAWLTLAAILGTFAVNVWSNFAPLNGRTIGEISNTQFAEVRIVPANYAFAIWGLIYLGMIGFGIYQCLSPQRFSSEQATRLQAARFPLILASIAQALWIFFFLLGQYWLSVVAMLAILLPLILSYLKLEIARPVSRDEKWLVQVPISVYLGWISVATIVNVALALYSQSWTGWGLSSSQWAMLLIVIATILGALVNFRRQDQAFPLVIVWALIAIAVKQSSIPGIAVLATVLALGLALLVLLQQYRFSSARKRP